MRRSIKGRMIQALVLWMLVAWALPIGIVYLCATDSQTSVWDDKLQSIGTKVLQILPAEIGSHSAGFDRTLQLRHDVVAQEHELTFQVWSSGGTRLLASTPGAPRAPLRADFKEGFTNVEIGDQEWRVYSVADRSGSVHVQVGNDRRMINAGFQKYFASMVAMTTVGLALTGLMMWWSVRKTLGPLAHLEQTTRDRSRFDLTPLPTERLPCELLPLVDAFNHVLSHLDQAIKAERQFISDAAHELRTPLSALQAQFEVALRSRTEEERSQSLRKLLVGVQRSTRLAEQLLDLARLEAGNHAPVRNWYDLQDIVLHVANEFEVSASRQTQSIELAVQPCRVHCDIDEMGILVRNLVDNALRYTPPGGRVLIRCGHRDEGEGPRPFLEVADNGPGVPVEEKEAIFERFHRVPGNGAVRGAGIGLSLVSRIARMHRARIETGAGFGDPGLSVRLLFPPFVEAT